MPDPGVIYLNPEDVQEAKAGLNSAATDVESGVAGVVQVEPETRTYATNLLNLKGQMEGALQSLSSALTKLAPMVHALSQSSQSLQSGIDTMQKHVFPPIERGTKGRGSAEFQQFLATWNHDMVPIEGSVSSMATTSRDMDTLLQQLAPAAKALNDNFEPLTKMAEQLVQDIDATMGPLRRAEGDLQSSIPSFQGWVNRLQAADTM